MWQQQWQIFCNGLVFYTRIPGPNSVTYNDQRLNQANRYFPLIGLLVAAISLAVYFIAVWFLPSSMALLLTMGAAVLLTGAFHEDGFADLCDGFGGAYTAERVLAIMKDSRVGTYGVVGLFLLLTLKWQALQAIPVESLAVAWLAAHVLSRSTAITLIALLPYVRLDETSKVKPVAQVITRNDLLVAWIWPIGVSSFAGFKITVAMFCVSLVLLIVARHWFRRRIGGYTGDCLGAVQQVSEVACLFVFVAILA